MYRLTAILACILIGCGSGDGTYEGNYPAGGGASAGNIGDPCASSKDCAAIGAAAGICMTVTEHFEHDTAWPGGYCTFGCDTKNPQCPLGTVCSTLGLFDVTGARCVLSCGSDADCRADYGYECYLGKCIPIL